MRSVHNLASLLVLLAFAPMPAVAGTVLYGAAHQGPDGPSTLYVIDALTGEGTQVGSIGFERVSGLDVNPNTNTLYATAERSDGSNTHVLITIDAITGAGTEVGPTGVEDFLVYTGPPIRAQMDQVLSM